MTERIRVLVVDDSALMRKLIPQILQTDSSIEVVGTAMDGNFGLRKIEELKPQVVTLDLEMPGMDGKKFVDYARAKGVPAKRIVVTSSHSADELHERFRIGETIAVINKTEAKQQEAFLMILDSIMRR